MDNKAFDFKSINQAHSMCMKWYNVNHVRMNMSLTSNLQKNYLAKIIGNRIRALRKIKKMSIEELAFASDMEYAQLSRIERGVVNCTTYQLYKISLSLEQRLSFLFENIESEINMTN